MKSCQSRFHSQIICSWRYAMAVLLTLQLGGTQTVYAQENPWFFGLYTHSNSFISNNVLGLVGGLVNGALAKATDGAASVE